MTAVARARTSWYTLQHGPHASGVRSIDPLKKRLLGEHRTKAGLRHSPSDDNVTGKGELGMRPDVAAWWNPAGQLQDPLQDWLGREQNARAAYKRCCCS